MRQLDDGGAQDREQHIRGVGVYTCDKTASMLDLTRVLDEDATRDCVAADSVMRFKSIKSAIEYTTSPR